MCIMVGSTMTTMARRMSRTTITAITGITGIVMVRRSVSKLIPGEVCHRAKHMASLTATGLLIPRPTTAKHHPVETPVVMPVVTHGVRPPLEGRWRHVVALRLSTRSEAFWHTVMESDNKPEHRRRLAKSHQGCDNRTALDAPQL